MAHANSIDSSRVLVWDIPIRLFHWLLAGSFALAWLSRGDRYLDVHVFAGYLITGLLLFRLAWGFVGEASARFKNFAYPWRAAAGFLRAAVTHRPQRYLGHNPAGSWAVFALLATALLVTVSGLLTLGGEERHGIFAGWLSYAQGDAAHTTHEALAWLMLGLVTLHIAGVVFESLVQRENLTTAMLSGYKTDTGAHRGSSQACADGRRLTGMLLIVTVTASALLYFRGYWLGTPEHPYRPFTGPALPDNAVWREECGACHLAFHPSLLPARSWKRMLAQQDRHFGEDLALAPQVTAEIAAFLQRNAAESLLTETAWKVSHSTAPNETPQKITQTAYWKNKHAALPESVWKSPQVKQAMNCAACHLDADEGTFQDGAMRVPGK